MPDASAPADGFSPAPGPWQIRELIQQFRSLQCYRITGRVRRCQGSRAVCEGLSDLVGLGDACWIEQAQYNSRECGPSRQRLLAEVVAVDEAGTHLLPFERLDGIGIGARVTVAPDQDRMCATEAWLGRVLDAFGRPLDGGPPLPAGPVSFGLKAAPVEAHRRRDPGPRLDLGVRALNLFTPCRQGQRLGIFAGSGVGKSTLLAMLARHGDADALVVGLIGERGRELAGLINDWLGPAGLARAVVVVATSDVPAMVRRRAAYVTLTVAEALRERGLRVLCLFDSLPASPRRCAKSISRRASRPPAGAIRPACSPSCPGFWSAPAPARGRAASPRCSRCWSRATI
jgi:flagellum-specific ATP synthase